ncbi:MAG: F0F1 ATP synthase subunit gamma [Patescibacteria group bacterium]
MIKPQELEGDIRTMGTLMQLTGVFEGLASMQIAKVKNQVLQAQGFFNELWAIYTQIRVDSVFHFGRMLEDEEVVDKELYIVITAEGSFTGDIDHKLISYMLRSYDPVKQDVIVVGHHGAVELKQNGVEYKRYFKLPAKDRNINVSPIIKEVQRYKSTRVFYQTYVSLTIQDVRSIELSSIVEETGKGLKTSADFISEETYIFEPSTHAVVSHLERSMLQIALSQVILESKLAQYASRFRAMSAAHTKAEESLDEVKLLYSRAKRAIKDERLREVVNGLKQTRKKVVL